jgi:hypothetical protein
MLSSRYVEGRSTTIHIPGVTANVFESILEYIYTDQVTIKDGQQCVELLMASNKILGLEGLKRQVR